MEACAEAFKNSGIPALRESKISSQFSQLQPYSIHDPQVPLTTQQDFERVSAISQEFPDPPDLQLQIQNIACVPLDDRPRGLHQKSLLLVPSQVADNVGMGNILVQGHNLGNN